MRPQVPFLFFTLAVWLLLTTLREVKFGGGWNIPRRPPRDDLLLSALSVLAASLASWAHPLLGALASLAACLALLGLWLDALLFRAFTIELGPGGAAGVVPSALFHELWGMGSARRFLTQSGCFLTALPALAAGLFVPAILVAWALLAALLPELRRLRLFAALTAATLALQLSGAPGAPHVAAALAIGLLLWAGDQGPSLLRPFFFGRPPPPRTLLAEGEGPDFLPCAHPRSHSHGLLRGADVILFSIESMSRALVEEAGAQLPLLERLCREGLHSRNHFCLCPLTNEAHTVLYASAYRGNGSFPGPEALARAGYARLYLTTVDTREYGLREILDAAGMEVLDAADFRAQRPGTPVTDALLPSVGLELLQRRLPEGGPFFLHVHTAGSHLPYRVEDPRFSRFDPSDDRGRYLDALEEADHHLSTLLSALESSGLTRDPLIVLTADHGQTFGALHYRSHGSAVVGEEILVPFALGHPRLPPRTLPFSSHLDVMPTLLDLLGLDPPCSLGRSLLLEADPSPRLLLWAGRPSRSATSNYGLVEGAKKWMIDRVLDRVHEMDWNDESARLLEGAEKEAVKRRVGEIFQRSGLR